MKKVEVLLPDEVYCTLDSIYPGRVGELVAQLITKGLYARGRAAAEGIPPPSRITDAAQLAAHLAITREGCKAVTRAMRRSA